MMSYSLDLEIPKHLTTPWQRRMHLSDGGSLEAGYSYVDLSSESITIEKVGQNHPSNQLVAGYFPQSASFYVCLLRAR